MGTKFTLTQSAVLLCCQHCSGCARPLSAHSASFNTVSLVFQPKTEDDAFEEVDEKELDSSWATSSPVYLDKEAQPVAAAQPSSQLRRVETAEASVEVDSLLADLPDGGPPPAAGVASASAEVSMPLDDALDASAALTTLQEDDYRGFASKHSAVAEDKPVDEVQQSGSLGDSLRGLLGMGKASSAPAAPPPPPPPAPKSKLKLKYARAALPRQSETSGRRVRQEVDTNGKHGPDRKTILFPFLTLVVICSCVGETWHTRSGFPGSQWRVHPVQRLRSRTFALLEVVRT